MPTVMVSAGTAAAAPQNIRPNARTAHKTEYLFKFMNTLPFKMIKLMEPAPPAHAGEGKTCGKNSLAIR